MTVQKVRQSNGDEPRIFYGYFVVAAALISMSVIWAVYYAFGIFFRPVLDEFGWTRAMTSGAFSLSLIINGLLSIAMGGLTDRFGPRLVMTLCGFLLGLGYLLMSQISTLWQLYLFCGIIVGAGMSGSFIPLASTVARWFVERRGFMTGIVVSGTGVGALIGPVVAIRLISTYGWRLSYFILGSIVLAVVVLSAQVIKRDPAQVGQVPYGENQGEEKGLSQMTDGLSLTEAVYTGRFWVFSAMCFCYGFCVFAVMVHMAPHAAELGISGTGAANILATLGALGIAGKLLLGRVGDKIGSRQILLIGFILMSSALLWLAPAGTAWMLYPIAGIFGFAYGGISVSHSPLVARLFGLRSHGLIFGVFGLSVTIGAAIGPFLTGHLFDVTGSYGLAFLVSAAISLSGIIAAAFLR